MRRRERPPTNLYDVVYVRLRVCTYVLHILRKIRRVFRCKYRRYKSGTLLPTIWAQVWLGSARRGPTKKKRRGAPGIVCVFFYRPDLHSQRPSTAYGSTKACQAESPLSACRLPRTRRKGEDPRVMNVSVSSSLLNRKNLPSV